MTRAGQAGAAATGEDGAATESCRTGFWRFSRSNTIAPSSMGVPIT